MKKNKQPKQTTVEVPATTEKHYMKIYPNVYAMFLNPNQMDLYIGHLNNKMLSAVDDEQYEEADIYRKIISYYTNGYTKWEAEWTKYALTMPKSLAFLENTFPS
jgi:excinuclease UvrABC nuclease subunit